tara:strand:+ start:4260 stop:5546 length:1287 start_codon:yes stop_codon:yes gene_type:complete
MNEWLNLYGKQFYEFVFIPEVQFQACTACGTLVLAFFLSKLCLKFSPKSTEEDIVKVWKNKTWKLLERILFPLISAFALLVALSAFERMAWSTNELLKPVLSLSIAWLSYRMIGFFIKSRAWLRLLAVLAFGLAALQCFGLLDKSIELLGVLAFNLGDRRVSVLDLLNGIVILMFLLWISSFLGASGEKRIKELPHLPPSLQVLLAKVLRAFLVFVSFAIALSTVGLDLSSFALLGGAIGVGIGFGLQKVVSNLVSGLILLIDRSIKPGDVIEIEGTYGWINSLRARYASIITRDGKEHLIPNEDLITNRVINWSFSDRNVRVRVPLGISYDSDPKEAIDLCLEAAQSVPRTLQVPNPKCLVVGFGDNAIEMELRFWIDDPSNGVGNVRSEVLLAIWDRFKQNGINIPFPQRDLHIRNFPESMRTKDS